MKLRSVLNWTLLTVNGILFACLMTLAWNHRHEIFGSPFQRRVEDDAKKMGMNVYLAKFPFAVFTPVDSSSANHFALFRYDPPLVVSAESPKMVPDEGVAGETNDARTTAMLHIGEEFSLIVDYAYSSSGGYRVHDVQVVRDVDDGRECFFDFGSDGTYDFHMFQMFQDGMYLASKHEVWFQSRWVEVKETMGRYRKRLADGQEVLFDVQLGKWRAVADH